MFQAKSPRLLWRPRPKTILFAAAALFMVSLMTLMGRSSESMVRIVPWQSNGSPLLDKPTDPSEEERDREKLRQQAEYKKKEDAIREEWLAAYQKSEE